VRSGGRSGGRPFGPQGPTIHIPNFPPQNWVRHAACAGHDPDHWFVPEQATYRYARPICAACPVRVDCLDWAMRAGEYQGMWGGLSPGQRRQLRRRVS
jgi:WhiB family redox-sensing transcriptional regulator